VFGSVAIGVIITAFPLFQAARSGGGSSHPRPAACFGFCRNRRRGLCFSAVFLKIGSSGVVKLYQKWIFQRFQARCAFFSLAARIAVTQPYRLAWANLRCAPFREISFSTRKSKVCQVGCHRAVEAV